MYTELIENIKSHLAAGGVVMLSTYTRSWQYDKPGHAECFKLGADGAPLVRRGRKHWDDFRGAAVRFYTWKKQD